MAHMRVISAGLDEGVVILRVRAALRDSDVTSVTIHKDGSHLYYENGEFVVGKDGLVRPIAEAVQTC